MAEIKFKLTPTQETIIGLSLIVLSIVFYRFPRTYLAADAMAVLAAVLCGRKIVAGAVAGLSKGRLNVDELISMAIIASLILGEYLVAAEVALIMTVGAYLEERAMEKSRRAIDELAALIPARGRLKTAAGERLVALSELRPGDLVLVQPGEEIPVDGRVKAGSSLVNEGKITGETRLQGKKPGDAVFAGSLNFDGVLEIETLKAGTHSALARMVELTGKALEEKTPTVRLADRFAAWFTPLVLSLTFLVYVLSGDIFRAITVLVVVCPCTLVLAIPSALVAALGKAVQSGILPKGGVYLERAAEVDTLILDKTGTLTLGSPKIREIIPLDGLGPDSLLGLAAVAERHSGHPIAREILAAAEKRRLELPEPEESRLIPGHGMLARYQGQEIVVGNGELLQKGERSYQNLGQALEVLREQEKLGRTSFFVAVDQEVKGVIALEDALREDTLKSIELLRKLIPRLLLLTGDNYQAAYRVAGATGILEFKAKMLPEDKVNLLHELKGQGRTVAAVGDGINDAPLLAGADVGIAMGDLAAGLTLEAGSVILVSGELTKLPLFFRLAKATRAVIRQNIVIFALIYNFISFYLAAAGYLTPLGGAVVHNIGSTMVVLNSLRLLRFR